MFIHLTKSLRGRLALYFGLGITISLLISTVVSVGLVQRYLRQKTVADLQGQARVLADLIQEEGLPVGRYIRDLEKMYQTRAIIVPYANRTLKYLPQDIPQGQEVQPAPLELSFIDWDLLMRGETQVTETKLPESSSDVVIVVADGFKSGQELIGAVVLTKPVRSLQSWVPLAGWFLVAAAVSLTISMFLAFMLARRLSRPLHEITLAASAVAAGDFSHRVAVRSEDEIGHLADAFRYMSDEVQKAQEQQREFVINVSHELKTPLTAIAGHVQALREGIATDPVDVAKSLEIVSSQTKRLSRLIEDLLSLAKFDARQFGLEIATVSLSRVIGTVEDTFSLDAQERRLELVVADGAEGIILTTDPDRLRQVLSNLVHNALVHTPPDGRVEIKARRTSGKVEITIADTGTGIPAADLSHVFERFYRSGKKAKEAGLGLGLAISRELVQAMGGEITVKSELGEGTTFTVTLPG